MMFYNCKWGKLLVIAGRHREPQTWPKGTSIPIRKCNTFSCTKSLWNICWGLQQAQERCLRGSLKAVQNTKPFHSQGLGGNVVSFWRISLWVITSDTHPVRQQSTTTVTRQQHRDEPPELALSLALDTRTAVSRAWMPRGAFLLHQKPLCGIPVAEITDPTPLPSTGTESLLP